MPDSALFGQPPKTDTDYWIIRSILLSAGLNHVDPNKGLKLPFLTSSSPQGNDSRGPGIIAGMSVAIVIMVVVTVARLLVRSFKRELRWGADDWLIIPAAILAVTYPALQIGMVLHGGAGKHVNHVTYHEFYIFNWLGSFSKMFFFLSVAFIKMSITAFNMRLTGLSSRKWMIAHWTFMGVLIAYALTALFINVFQCDPPSANFDSVAAGKLPTQAKCISDDYLGTTLSVAHAVTDFCLLAVPIIVLWKVQIHRTTKIRLYLIFSIGAFSCVSSVLRQVSQGRIRDDPFYTFTGLLLWTVVDLATGILVASLPVLSALIPHRRRKTGSGGSGPTDQSGSGGSFLPKKNLALKSTDSQEGIICKHDVELVDHVADAGYDGYGHSSKVETTSNSYMRV